MLRLLRRLSLWHQPRTKGLSALGGMCSSENPFDLQGRTNYPTPATWGGSRGALGVNRRGFRTELRRVDQPTDIRMELARDLGSLVNKVPEEASVWGHMET